MSSPVTDSAYAIGPYHLIGQIGEGGMGVVYLARGPEESRVAVKVLRPHVVGDSNGRARLAREVTSLRRIRSRRIAEVYDADPWGHTPYIVTRYIPGPSLREVVDSRGPMAGSALMRLARGLAEALAVVHRADVVHRDVKPSNVLIEGGDPVLIDFGLAQLSDDLTLTQSGWVLGTPGYLAPEILYGDHPTPAADVHAWGATLVYAATGQGPYGGGPALAVIDRIRRGEPNLDGVPEALLGVVAAALRPDPANRPTARQIVHMIDSAGGHGWEATARTAADEPTTVNPLRHRPSPPDRTRASRVERAAPDLAPPGLEQPYGIVDEDPTAARRTLSAPVDSFEDGDGRWERPAEPESGRWRRRSFLVSVLCLVVAGTIAAPVITLLWAILAGWAVRTADLAEQTVRGWRADRGPRRLDGVSSGLLLPWFALRRLGSTLGSAGWMTIGSAAFLVLARFGPDVLVVPSLVVAGLVIGLTGWFGPMTADLRSGSLLITEALPRRGLAAAVTVVLVMSGATCLLAVQQISGTTFSPL